PPAAECGEADSGTNPRQRRALFLARRRRRRALVAIDAIGAHRPVDVLQRLLAEIAETQVELARNLVVDARRDIDAAGLGDALEPRGDVDSVAEQVIAFHHHVAEVHSDAELHPLVLGQRIVARLQRVLDLYGAAHRLRRARELGEHAVARGVDDAP